LGEGWMPWKECSVMAERLRFVARLLEGGAMTEVCREFGISRNGLAALSDRSRRPMRDANRLPPQIEDLIVGCKRGKPHWGPARSASC
jgi:transposase-like protein